jgi:hypothetical protein
MKKVLLLAAALMVSGSAFAAEDLCEANLQKLQDEKVSTGQIGQPLLDQIRGKRMEAQAAQKAGDTKKCIDLTTQALVMVNKADKGQ